MIQTYGICYFSPFLDIIQGWRLTGFIFVEDDNFLFKLLFVVFHNSLNIWQKYSRCRPWQTTSLTPGHFCNLTSHKMTSKDLLKESEYCHMHEREAFQTDRTHRSSRQKSYLSACSKIKLVEQTEVISYTLSKRNKEYTYIYWMLLWKLQNVHLCLNTH